MASLPVPIAAAVARAEQVAQDSWAKAEAAGMHPDSKAAFLDAVRVAYVTGIQATIEAITGDVEVLIKVRRQN
jgi:hypothetical protein